MKHGSLFSGIGGFDLAAEWMGWENVFHCEWNEFGKKVLNYYWPNAISYHDITKTDFTIHRGSIDVLTGGFPCQPYSLAGRRRGTEDDRHLWPEMRRAIREISPRWIVGENVLGLVNWNGGLVFHEVQSDLETEGYEVFPYLLNAASVGAPHKRDRIWFVAHSNNKRLEGNASERIQRDEGGGIGIQNGVAPRGGFKNSWEAFPTVAPICDGNDGLPSKLDGITFPKWKTESLKAGGNAVCPPLVMQIFKTIEAYEATTKT